MPKKSKRKRFHKKKKENPSDSDREIRETVNQTTPTTSAAQQEQEDPNPLLTKQSEYLSSIPPTIQNSFFSSEITPATRALIWSQQASLGEELVNKYAWATPDSRAMNILKEFSPLVEIGCGSNAYWLRTMQRYNIDVLGFDENVHRGGLIKEKKRKKRKDGRNSLVRKGGPEVLSSSEVIQSKRNLFLCYPDEEPIQTLSGESTALGSLCLQYFSGEYVVHVGELYGDALDTEQAPWGRSSSAGFQERLAVEFHCILRARLTSWVHVRDSISVWKRSITCPIVFQGEEGEDDEEVLYRHIPEEERLPMDIAAPCVAHLL